MEDRTDGTGAGEETPASLEETIAGEASKQESENPFDPGSAIGRYVVISRLGAGAMGAVFAAYDPELDRKIAIKVLHDRARGDRDAARTRLQREAQALAKLNHPNVVAVHDVGVHRGRVFLAMEMVDGVTLEDWMARGRPRRSDWREVLSIFIAAGRGLAAAHARGLIHRDFKPANVMIGDDGRVRVMDFGLARDEPGATDAPSYPATLSGVEHAGSGPKPSVTRTGMLVGTPAYMAPEQFSAQGVSALSDQFGYCVSLFEALYGQRPFAGDTPAQIAFAVTEGRLRAPPQDRVVPGWLKPVVRRGLMADPDRRFAAMSDLLAALEVGEARRRRLVAYGSIGGMAAVAAAVWGAASFRASEEAKLCQVEAESHAGAWHEERTQVREALLATGLSYANSTAERVLPALDEYVQELSQARADACVRSRVEARWDETTYARASWCFQQRQLRLDVLVEDLGQEMESLETTVSQVYDLPPVAECLDEGRLAASAPPPEREEPVKALLRTLHGLDQLAAAREFEQGVDQAAAATVRARELGWGPLIPLAHLKYGEILELQGSHGKAEEQYQVAYFEAARGGDAAVQSDAAISLARDVGYQLGRTDEGKLWVEHGKLLLTRLEGEELELQRAALLRVEANVGQRAGEYDTAIEQASEALAIQRRIFGDAHPAVSGSLGELAGLHYYAGQYEAARDKLEEAAQSERVSLGPDHPSVAQTLSSLGLVLSALGEYDEARAAAAEAVEIYESGDKAHPELAAALNHLAEIDRSQGRYDDAIASFERALAIQRETRPAGHPEIATTPNNLATAHQTAGAADRALPIMLEALQIREEKFGPSHPRLAATIYNLSNVYSDLRRLEEARATNLRALDMWRETLGPDHRNIGYALRQGGQVEFDRGHAEEARTLLEDGLAMLERTMGADSPDVADTLLRLSALELSESSPALALEYAQRATRIREPEGPGTALGWAQFHVARAQWQAASRDSDRADAVARVQRALEMVGDGDPKRSEKIEAWLRERS